MRKWLFILTLTMSVNANSAVEHQGLVTDMFAEGGIIRVRVCSAANNCKSFWIKPTNDYAKTVISMLLSAKISKNAIWIQGSDNTEPSWPYNGTYKFASMHLKE